MTSKGWYRRIEHALGVAVLAVGVWPARAESDPAGAFLDAMVRNVGMVEVDCPTLLDPPPEGGARICLGPYWSWKDFRRLWDESSGDRRRTPADAVPVTGWESTPEGYARSYVVGTSPVRVIFDRKRGSVTLTSGPPERGAATASAAATPAATAVVVAGPASAAAAEMGLPGGSPPPTASGEAEGEPGRTGWDVEPKVVPASRVPARYPPAARPRRLTARVVLNVIVGPDSVVEGVIVESCSEPGKGFEDAAVDAVAQWKFLAGQRDGQPVRAETHVVLLFTP